MKICHTLLVFIPLACTVACDRATEQEAIEPQRADQNKLQTNDYESFEIVPGLVARILHQGNGRAAVAGDNVEVHYTGWLYDEAAANYRGEKFDSSIDRGERFQFPLGAGRVIKGWDQGVAGMTIGERRELTIAPEMAYGDRGAGNLISPGATLVFEVELFAAESLASAE